MKIFATIVLTLLIFGGCSVNTPPVSEYRINTKIQNKNFKESTCRDKSLKVVQAFSSSSLMSINMNYGIGLHKQYVFSQSQWAESPNRAITSEIVKYIKSINLFKNVQISKSRTLNSVLLETNIEDFMQYFSSDEKESYANVSITLTLLSSKTNLYISSKTFKSKVKVENMNANSGVTALNRALENVLKESGEWLSDECK